MKLIDTSQGVMLVKRGKLYVVAVDIGAYVEIKELSLEKQEVKDEKPAEPTPNA